MHRLRSEERRRSPRRRIYRLAKIELGAGIHARDCHVIDISDDGVRLNVGGLDVPNEFVLLLSGDGVVREKHTKWSGGAAMKLAPSSLVSSDLALPCRISSSREHLVSR